MKDNLVEALRELNKLKGENIELTKKVGHGASIIDVGLCDVLW